MAQDKTRPATEKPLSPPSLTDKPAKMPPAPGPDPTRYGDWERNGKCVDF